jgi:hypothetical protein
MKNEEVSKGFADGADNLKTENVFIKDRALFSYGQHFPIAFRLWDKQCLFNADKYSSSTSRHQSQTLRALQSRGWNIIFVRTKQIKEAYDRQITSMNELMIDNI